MCARNLLTNEARDTTYTYDHKVFLNLFIFKEKSKNKSYFWLHN